MSSTDSEDCLKWEEYFMGIAVLASKRSKDPDTKVGACVVSADNSIIGVSYNGHPKVRQDLKNDELFPWTKDRKDYKKNKHMYVCHAELNAIAHSSGSLKDSSMYVTLNPCNECAKLIVQSGVKEVFYLTRKNFRDNALDAAMEIFEHSNVKVHQFTEYMKNKYDISPKTISISLQANDNSL